MNTELIVMLTHNDLTVRNAYQVFEQCKDTKALYWGFKEKPLPIEEMRRIYAKMKDCGKRTVLEVVAYSEKEGLEGAQMAASCGCDILMGTCFHESILSSVLPTPQYHLYAFCWPYYWTTFRPGRLCRLYVGGS